MMFLDHQRFAVLLEVTLLFTTDTADGPRP
jgi:hypothetical protein